MKLFGMPLNSRMAIWLGLHALLIVDIILITITMLFSLPENITMYILVFDFFVCILLLIEWIMNFYLSTPKTLFLKQKDNWLSLIASIPFDVILPVVIPGIALLRYLRLLKLIRILVLFNRFFDGIEKFIQKTNIDKILGGVLFTIIIFTVLLNLYGPSYGLFDDFYFVIVTLTTVGYGDIVPRTFNEKIIALLLLFIGIFIFSTITAAISSYLTDRLISDEGMDKKLDLILSDLDKLQKENDDLKNEIKELKELVNND